MSTPSFPIGHYSLFWCWAAGSIIFTLFPCLLAPLFVPIPWPPKLPGPAVFSAWPREREIDQMHILRYYQSLCFPPPAPPHQMASLLQFGLPFSLLEREAKSLSHVWLFATPWTIACQAPLSMEFSRQEHWSGLPFPSPGDPPNPGIEPGSATLWADALPSEPPGKT